MSHIYRSCGIVFECRGAKFLIELVYVIWLIYYLMLLLEKFDFSTIPSK